MMQLSLDAAVRASSQQVSCDIAGEAVLLNMCDGQYYGLNEVGASIWRLIQEPRSLLAIRDALLEEFIEIGAVECEGAVVSFVREMIALKLVDIV